MFLLRWLLLDLLINTILQLIDNAALLKQSDHLIAIIGFQPGQPVFDFATPFRFQLKLALKNLGRGRLGGAVGARRFVVMVGLNIG